jgi:CheY-like chemotaxis protein
MGANQLTTKGKPDAERPVDSRVVSRVVRELNTICKTTTFDFAQSIGKVVIDNFYGGDLGGWRDRGPKDASFRTLAKHPDLPLSPSALYRSVAIYEVCTRLAIGPRGRLSSSHVREVLALSSEHQERLLRRAEGERWSVAKLREEAAGIADRRSRGGRKRKVPLLATLETLGRLVDESRGCLVGADESALELSSEQAREAAEVLRCVQQACSMLETKLRAEGASNADAGLQSDILQPEQEHPPALNLGAGTGDLSSRHRKSSGPFGILIVEDNPAYARALARLAADYGEVTIAGTVGEAHSAIARAKEGWKAFILDAALPDGSGIELLARAREHSPSTRAMLITGYLDSKKANAAYKLGAQFLAKPFGTADVLRFLDSLV